MSNYVGGRSIRVYLIHQTKDQSRICWKWIIQILTSNQHWRKKSTDNNKSLHETGISQNISKLYEACNGNAGLQKQDGMGNKKMDLSRRQHRRVVISWWSFFLTSFSNSSLIVEFCFPFFISFQKNQSCRVEDYDQEQDHLRKNMAVSDFSGTEIFFMILFNLIVMSVLNERAGSR